MTWIAVEGAHIGRDEGDMICITLRPTVPPEVHKPFGFMADEKTLREIGEGLIDVANQMKKRGVAP